MTALDLAAQQEDSAAGLGGAVAIELDSSQVDQVVRAASESGAMSVLLGGEDLRSKLARELNGHWPPQLDDRRLSRSLLLGLLVLASLPSDGSYIGLGEVARVTRMSKSTTHRYVSTLMELGLAERDRESRKYRLASDAGARRSR